MHTIGMRKGQISLDQRVGPRVILSIIQRVKPLCESDDHVAGLDEGVLLCS
jgi:hypothetical protein